MKKLIAIIITFLICQVNVLANQTSLDYLYGYAAFEEGNCDTALKLTTKAANSGHAGAKFNLGWWYTEGKCVKRNCSKGIKFYTESANENDQESQLILGKLYTRGYCGKKDLEKAHFYLSKIISYKASAQEYLIDNNIIDNNNELTPIKKEATMFLNEVCKERPNICKK